MNTTDDTTAHQAAKKQALESFLDKGRVQLRVDARRKGVRVPDQFGDDSMLILNVSWRYANTDMVINERGVAATLRFNQVPFRCVLPWPAVFAMIPVEGEPLVWPLDVPVEFGGPPRDEDEPEPAPVEAVRPRLSVVTGGARPAPEPASVSPLLEAIEREDDLVDPEPDPEPPSPPAARAPWLKLVQ